MQTDSDRLCEISHHTLPASGVVGKTNLSPVMLPNQPRLYCDSQSCPEPPPPCSMMTTFSYLVLTAPPVTASTFMPPAMYGDHHESPLGPGCVSHSPQSCITIDNRQVSRQLESLHVDWHGREFLRSDINRRDHNYHTGGGPPQFASHCALVWTPLPE